MTDQESVLPPPAGTGAPRVFVSYAWEDDEYRTWVKRLSVRLRDNGVNVRLDAWHCRNQTIPEFMKSEARAADKVLVLCSPKYREKVHAMEDGERITGSGWEAMLVGSALFAGQTEREKFVVSLTRGKWETAAPDFLIGLPYFDLSAAERFESQYLGLLHALHDNQDAAPPIWTPPPTLEPASPLPLGGRSETPPVLASLRDALLATDTIPELDERSLQSILRHSPRSLDEYRLARIAEWSQPRYALDKRFTQLTLLLDQGPDAQGARWQAQAQSFDDLREVLAQAAEPALVVLGPPGCGKSTLLRRLELDLALDALRAPSDDAVLSFFLPLNRYRPHQPGSVLPMPGEWLTQEWARRHPRLPAFIGQSSIGGQCLLFGVLLTNVLGELRHQLRKLIEADDRVHHLTGPARELRLCRHQPPSG